MSLLHMGVGFDLGLGAGVACQAPVGHMQSIKRRLNADANRCVEHQQKKKNNQKTKQIERVLSNLSTHHSKVINYFRFRQALLIEVILIIVTSRMPVFPSLNYNTVLCGLIHNTN